jgi:hypothetical protein
VYFKIDLGGPLEQKQAQDKNKAYLIAMNKTFAYNLSIWIFKWIHVCRLIYTP